MEKTSAQDQAIALMSEVPAVYLTTIDHGGWPETRAMLNLRNKCRYPGLIPLFASHGKDLLLYFTTNTTSGKIAQIANNNKASAYFCAPSEWRGLMLGGTVSVVSDIGIKGNLWQKEWTMYYPGGAEDPDYTILCLKPIVSRYYECLDSYSWNLEDES
ncbi:MAG: pyridoxamine 5'-phosphate oxidase family protein [Methanobacteriota archaeon]